MSVALDQFAVREAETILADRAGVFLQASAAGRRQRDARSNPGPSPSPSLEARYKVLLDQIPAVVFMAYLDEGIGEAYVSPQIEATLGFSREEWLEDPRDALA